MSSRSRSASQSAGRLSPAALNLAEWFRQVQRLVALARQHGPADDRVTHVIERLVEEFAQLIEYHAPVSLRCTPVELWLRQELVVRQAEGPDEEPLERGVPFLLFRDGIRTITFDANASRDDARALLGALARVAGAPGTDEDLTTLLWRHELHGLVVELAPFEETTPRTAPITLGSNVAPSASVPVPAPDASHLPWLDFGTPGDPVALLPTLRRAEGPSLDAWQRAWHEAAASGWAERIETLVHDVLARDESDATREALTAAVASALASAAQRCDWAEATQALECLRRTDPERRWSNTQLTTAMAALDAEQVAARLDHADHDELARFFALAVRIGPCAVDLVVRVLAYASRQRVRAAATTALGYACAEDPARLLPYLRDTRWHVARNIVVALGQMGGEETGEPLTFALRHPDVRVRRAAVTAFGQVPVHRRTPLLLRELDTADALTLATILGMLAREPDPRTAAEILARIQSADFESRPEDVRLAFVGVLGELGDDRVVPALHALLHEGGWFARRTPERTAAAGALAQLGSPSALDVLHGGLRSRAEAVRIACEEALARRPRRETA